MCSIRGAEIYRYRGMSISFVPIKLMPKVKARTAALLYKLRNHEISCWNEISVSIKFNFALKMVISGETFRGGFTQVF